MKSQAAAPSRALKEASLAGLSAEDLKILKSAFGKDRLGVKVQSYNKERTRVMLVLYLQHTDVQDRLEEVDPSWSSEVLGESRQGDTTYVQMRLTIKGVSRENVGEGGDPKSAFSDALKRCAMLFGVGRYLYDSPTVWADYDDSRDRFKQWSVDDYEQALSRVNARQQRSEQQTKGLKTKVKPPAIEPAAANADGKARPREELNRVLMNLYRPFLTQFPQTQFAQLLQQRYGVGETRLMTVEQLEDLVSHLETKLRSVA